MSATAVTAVAADATASHALFDAVANDDRAAARHWLALHADVNAHQRPWQLTPLFVAAMDGDGAMVQLLLSAGADVNAVDREGKTALVRAIDLGNNQVVTLLLQAQADPNTVDHTGNTPLMHAVLIGDVASAKALIAHGADLNAVNAIGISPLTAAKRMRAAAVAMNAKADPEHMQMHGDHAHHMRTKAEALAQSDAMVQVLTKAGAQARELAFESPLAHMHH